MNYIGEIKIFGGDFEPKGWMFCDGRTLSSSRHPLLFSILGVMYGGNDNSFNLPNIPDLNGVRYIICVEGTYPERHI